MRQIKVIGQRKPKRNSHKSISNCHEDVTQQLRYSPPDSACVFIHMHCTLSLNKYFICFITFCFSGNYFLQSKRVRALSLTTGILARIWCFQLLLNPASISVLKTKPHSKQAEDTRDQNHQYY